MGPLISGAHRDRVAAYLDVAKSEGASVALDGREFDLPPEGFLLGPSVVDRVKPAMRLAREEIFGPGAFGGARATISTRRWRWAGNANTATARAFSPAAAGPPASSSGTSTPA